MNISLGITSYMFAVHSYRFNYVEGQLLGICVIDSSFIDLRKKARETLCVDWEI